MSVIELSDETAVTKALQSTTKPVVLTFVGNLTKADGTPSSSGKMKAAVEQLADDDVVGAGTLVLVKTFDAGGQVEKVFDVQSGPTTLLLEVEQVVGFYTADWLKTKVIDTFKL
jgi:hypothetical protein